MLQSALLIVLRKIWYNFSGDDLEELDGSGTSSKPAPPVPVNSHLHCRASNLDLAVAAPGSKELKTQKWVQLTQSGDCGIWCSLSGDYEDYWFLACDTFPYDRSSPVFQTEEAGSFEMLIRWNSHLISHDMMYSASDPRC